jgi:hypothetical protein
MHDASVIDECTREALAVVRMRIAEDSGNAGNGDSVRNGAFHCYLRKR